MAELGTAEGRIVIDPNIDSIVKAVHQNVGQELILITVDKVQICLMRNLDAMGRANAWVAPLGISLTILMVFPTTSFRDWGFPAATWQAIFIISVMLSVYWLARALNCARRVPSVENVIEELKKGSLEPAGNRDTLAESKAAS